MFKPHVDFKPASRIHARNKKAIYSTTLAVYGTNSTVRAIRSELFLDQSVLADISLFELLLTPSRIRPPTTFFVSFKGSRLSNLPIGQFVSAHGEKSCRTSTACLLYTREYEAAIQRSKNRRSLFSGQHGKKLLAQSSASAQRIHYFKKYREQSSDFV